MPKPWEKYAETPAASAKKPWERYGEMDGAIPTPAVSQLESGLRGAAQGASLGFADEGAGALDALKAGLGQVAKAGMFINSDALGNAYTRGRDESRAAYDAAQQANPGTFLAGQIGGGAALPVGGMNIAKGALLGGAQALGGSNAEDASGMARDTALGAGLGGVLGGAIPAASQALGRAGSAVGEAVEGASGFFKKEAGKLANRATKSSVGREALDEGVIKFGDRAQNISDRVGSKLEDILPGDESLALPGVSARVESLGKIREGIGKKIANDVDKPFISSGDLATLGSGFIAGGIPGVIVAGTGIAGKNLLNTRGAATGAVAMDNIGDILAKTPQMLGKFAAPLQAAQARGALNPTLFVLQQTNPEFRELVYGGQKDQ